RHLGVYGQSRESGPQRTAAQSRVSGMAPRRSHGRETGNVSVNEQVGSCARQGSSLTIEEATHSRHLTEGHAVSNHSARLPINAPDLAETSAWTRERGGWGDGAVQRKAVVDRPGKEWGVGWKVRQCGSYGSQVTPRDADGSPMREERMGESFATAQ
ncbi:da2af834-8d57-4b69-a22d-400674e61351, partial [Thermothielavioides terrestris]